MPPTLTVIPGGGCRFVRRPRGKRRYILNRGFDLKTGFAQYYPRFVMPR